MSDVSNDLGEGWQALTAMPADSSLWMGRDLFATPVWARVLTTLGAAPMFAWHARRELGVVVPVFHRLGLRIGFIGFPIAGPKFDAMPWHELRACATGVALAVHLDMVRMTQSLRQQNDTRAVAARSEAWIDDLQQWRLGDHKRLRKDLAFARRSAPELEWNDRGVDAKGCFDLYATTVARHGAQQKYTPAYFAALQQAARESPSLRFFTAVDGKVVRGFAVVALHGGVAYYLHGAVDAVYRRQGLGDMLLEKLIAYAQRAGAVRFTLMASPWDQAGLLQFKRKWADASGFSVTYDVGFSLPGRCAVLASRWQLRHDRRQAAYHEGHHDTQARV